MQFTASACQLDRNLYRLAICTCCFFFSLTPQSTVCLRAAAGLCRLCTSNGPLQCHEKKYIAAGKMPKFLAGPLRRRFKVTFSIQLMSIERNHKHRNATVHFQFMSVCLNETSRGKFNNFSERQIRLWYTIGLCPGVHGQNLTTIG